MRRGKRSPASKLARQARLHELTLRSALAGIESERRADALHDARALASGIRGVGIVTRGMAPPVTASVVRMTQGQWQAMAPDVPVCLSDERAAEYRRSRDRERDATRASNHLLASMRAADDVEKIADAMREGE